jgi:hypothetical protein
MGRGYHSRSPEEFREYLDSIRNNQKKRNWKHIIILIDIIIILFIFYFVYRYLNPSSLNPKAAQSYQTESLRVSVTASQSSGGDGALLFLLAENLSNSEVLVPNKDWKFQSEWLSPFGVLCDKRILVQSRAPISIPANSTAVWEIPVPPPSQTTEDSCKKSSFTERPRYGLDSFRKRTLVLRLQITNEKSELWEFDLNLNPYSRTE